MKPRRVLTIGSTGMLGGAVRRELIKSDMQFLEASRSRGLIFDAEVDSTKALLETAGLAPGDYVVNCVGLTKCHIVEEQPDTVARAVSLNIGFPIALAKAAESLGLRVIQVATDCVFSGREGNYLESSAHDAYDVYGKSKSIGEVKSDHVMHLRCSLVGPEARGKKSLFFEWVRGTPPNSQINGYINHNWNGLTSRAFARIVTGIIEGDKFNPDVHHLVPADALTKYELVRMELELLDRADVHLNAFETDNSVDRTLATNKPETNSRLLFCGGYERVPTIREMMEELPWEDLKESWF